MIIPRNKNPCPGPLTPRRSLPAITAEQRTKQRKHNQRTENPEKRIVTIRSQNKRNDDQNQRAHDSHLNQTIWKSRSFSSSASPVSYPAPDMQYRIRSANYSSLFFQTREAAVTKHIPYCRWIPEKPASRGTYHYPRKMLHFSSIQPALTLQPLQI